MHKFPDNFDPREGGGEREEREKHTERGERERQREVYLASLHVDAEVSAIGTTPQIEFVGYLDDFPFLERLWQASVDSRYPSPIARQPFAVGSLEADFTRPAFSPLPCGRGVPVGFDLPILGCRQEFPMMVFYHHRLLRGHLYTPHRCIVLDARYCVAYCVVLCCE